MQALGRLRLVHSKTRKRVFLLSNLPVEMPVDTYAQFNDLFPDKLELELIRKNNLPLTPLGLLKMRPDLSSSSPIAEKLLQRSKVRDPNRLKCIPDLMRHTAFVLEFEAENAGRWKPHRHLFLLPNQHQERLPELPEVNLTVGSVPIDHWVQFLEQGDQGLTEASGWGAIRNPHLVWA
jgi:hypothetical protein